jgi:hypothetical protein
MTIRRRAKRRGKRVYILRWYKHRKKQIMVNLKSLIKTRRRLKLRRKTR